MRHSVDEADVCHPRATASKAIRCATRIKSKTKICTNISHAHKITTSFIWINKMVTVVIYDRTATFNLFNGIGINVRRSLNTIKIEGDCVRWRHCVRCPVYFTLLCVTFMIRSPGKCTKSINHILIDAVAQAHIPTEILIRLRMLLQLIFSFPFQKWQRKKNVFICNLRKNIATKKFTHNFSLSVCVPAILLRSSFPLKISCSTDLRFDFH